jgi:polynucleotide 5'-kinase involved in rRNA processing
MPDNWRAACCTTAVQVLYVQLPCMYVLLLTCCQAKHHVAHVGVVRTLTSSAACCSADQLLSH